MLQLAARQVHSCVNMHSEVGLLGVDAGGALQVACTSADLQPLSYSEAVRLGKPPASGVAGGQVQPRPLLIRFGAVQQKHELLTQPNALRARQVYLDDDLTPFQRGLRAVSEHCL